MRCVTLGVCAAVVVLGYSTPGGVPAPPQATATLFEGARLIRGDGSAPLEDAAFVVEAGILKAVGPRGQVSGPAGAARVSLAGKTVMPVFVDLHAHVGFSVDGVFAPEHYTHDNIVDQLMRLEYYGVGAILSLGTDVGVDTFRIREEQRAGKVGGATIYLAGRGFVAPGGGPPVAPLEHVPYEVERLGLGRIFVRELAAQKVDMVKIWVDDRNGTRPKLAPEVYRAVIDEAHKQGLRVMAHVYYLEDAKALVRAGVDGFAHLVRDREIDDEFVQLMKERNVFTCAALGVQATSAGDWLDDPALAETVPPRVRAPLRASQPGPAAGDARRAAVISTMKRNIKKLSDAGVRIVFGTDTVTPGRFYGFNEHLELEGLVSAGLTPLQAITVATNTSAAALGVKQLGTIEPGKSADFIVLDANPLDNIANTRKITDVYRQGRALDRAALRAAWSK